MIQRYDFAPLDGITKVVFRQVYHRMFGGADRYFIPFFSPTDQHILTKRDQRELDPAANAGLHCGAPGDDPPGTGLSVGGGDRGRHGLYGGESEPGLSLRHRHRQGQGLPAFWQSRRSWSGSLTRYSPP